jgi:hypothetical protein
MQDYRLDAYPGRSPLAVLAMASQIDATSNIVR